MKIRWSADFGPADKRRHAGVALRPRRRLPRCMRNGHWARSQAEGRRVRRALDKLVVTVESTGTIVAKTPIAKLRGLRGPPRSVVPA